MPEPADVLPATDDRTLPWRGVLGVLVGVSLAFVAISYITLELVPHRFFQVGGGGHAYLNVGVEANVPTWWSAGMFVAAATLLLLLAALLRAENRAGAWATAAIAAILLAFSLDELASLHEQLYQVGRLIVSSETLPYVWLAVGIPLAIGVLVVAVLLARRIPAAARPLLLAGLATFFAGAVGMELVGSQLLDGHGPEGSVVVAAYHLEEALEMLGAALVVVAPLRTVRVGRTAQGVTLTVADA
ncbi:hypothetical protein AA0Y32_01080 [Georgenia phoenicis]|uniref:hypothetical protein n=1 Tax=unclassified Georgenia TaxID=2626815 RepID=UPI0039B10925